MTITFDATYENGVLKPVSPLPLKEHEEVRVTVEVRTIAPNTVLQIESDATSSNPDPLLAMIAELTRDLPPEVVDLWPTDGAAQHDHYLYGSPKRPE